ncbi:MAG: hypothetical protein PUP92_20825 [Rhizonema sp. PD38]|nr:hypothetical protein [Rhizonema sp. PD38]
MALTSTSLIAMFVCSFSNPAVAERVCVKTDTGKVVCGQLVQDSRSRTARKPNSSIPLDGKYSFSWVEEANKTNQCVQTKALQELTISADGLIDGYVNLSGPNTFSGKVNPDGSWFATLNTNGYEFKGNISNGVISGTYTAQPNCQGKVTGFKKP